MKNPKKLLRNLLLCVLACVLLVAQVACKKDEPETPSEDDPAGNTQIYDPETRPLVMSISTPDGVFNPFFSTSAYDSQVVGMTQIGMLSTTAKGEITCGDNEPCVVKAYQVTTDAGEAYTTYRFIIKNGIKFSDGSDLTIKDVLFNLYVYLDPSYTGSATIYSTKIVGLEQYRMQDDRADISEGAMDAFEQGFVDEAKERIQELMDYVSQFGKGVKEEDKPGDRWTAEQKAALETDYRTVAKLFLEELNTDWNTATDSMETYKDWGFTAAWQVFLLNDGGRSELLLKDAGGKYVKDEDGNCQLDPEVAREIEEYELAEYLEAHPEMSREEAMKQWAISTVYEDYFPGTVENTNAGNFSTVVQYWATADTLRSQFAAEAKSEYFKSTDKKVPTISGITTTTTTTDFSGNDLGATHDVLCIRIKGVDPKAIWNFSFTVAPMSYYSTHNWNGKDYINAFNAATGEFGLEFGSLAFMQEVINAADKVGLPVGAGPYMASTAKGTPATKGSEFMDANIIYFQRNDYFHTLGSGLHNAYIKYLKYKVVESDQIISALSRGDIDYGEPNATSDNIEILNEEGVAHIEIKTSGYGYVGINPRYVPNVSVRRAIMKAMNTQLILQNYYKGGLAELIYRPMSTTSWAYPSGATVYKDETLGLDYSFDAIGEDIIRLVEDAGYTKNSNGVYEKVITGFGTDTLDYTFTIAGASTDHPAYAMFTEAAKLLNRCGFNVRVVTSQTALSDLSSGKLAVWAAAWSSTIDPDMYQIYHKDSNATSVSNWGYPQIKNNKTLYATEWALIQNLSDLIDEGRSTNDQQERTEIYAEALDLIMQLAVEMPTYQRCDMAAYNAGVLNRATMTSDTELSPYNGLISRIWELNYN